MCMFTSIKVSNYIQLKDGMPDALLPNVVYQFSCLCDADSSYIGMTKRHLSDRIGEHLNLKSFKKKKKKSLNNDSATAHQ